MFRHADFVKWKFKNERKFVDSELYYMNKIFHLKSHLRIAFYRDRIFSRLVKYFFLLWKAPGAL